MAQYLASTETIRLIRDVEKYEKEVWRCAGRGGWGGWGGDYIKIYCYIITTSMTPALKTGSDESHFKVLLTVRDKVPRRCSQTTTFLKRERRAEAVSNRGPSAYQPNALPLGQTGSVGC